MKHELPALPYGYDALEPFIDAKTMELHHAKHHQAYVDKLNAALETHPELQQTPLKKLLRNLDAIPDDIRAAVRNHGGGHLNHSLFWTLLAPQSQGGGSGPSGDVATLLAASFSSVDSFKKAFTDSALKVFGSGWVWLVKDGETLSIVATPNQDTPWSQGKIPVLALDLWEHAYYLKYQNRRAEYVENWWHIVNWRQVGEYLKKD